MKEIIYLSIIWYHFVALYKGYKIIKRINAVQKL